MGSCTTAFAFQTLIEDYPEGKKKEESDGVMR